MSGRPPVRCARDISTPCELLFQASIYMCKISIHVTWLREPGGCHGADADEGHGACRALKSARIEFRPGNDSVGCSRHNRRYGVGKLLGGETKAADHGQVLPPDKNATTKFIEGRIARGCPWGSWY